LTAVDNDPTPRGRSDTWRIAFLLMTAAIVTGLLQGGGTRAALPIGTAFVPCGFALLAVLARAGDTVPAARPLALVLLTATVSALAMGSLALVVLNVVEPGSLGTASQEVEFLAGGEARLSFMMALLALSAATTMLGLFGRVRAAVHDIIPVEAERFSHALALAAAIAVSLVPLLPLFVLGKPPLPLPELALPPGSPTVVLPSFLERSLELGWFAVAVLIAAGPGAGRGLSALGQRLGVGTPAWWHLLLAAALGLGFAWLRPQLGAAIETWTTRPATTLPDPWRPGAMPWASLVGLSLLTATGTELTFRGFLQPRFGLVLTNIVLVAPLAWTSPWSSLFLLFALGMVLGMLRRLGSTVTPWVAHLAFLLASAQSS
jgi:hypothetical protein